MSMAVVEEKSERHDLINRVSIKEKTAPNIINNDREDTTMSWDSIKESVSDGDFIKLKSGESVLFHVLGGEPEEKKEHFIDNKPNKCDGLDCVLCKRGVQQRTSWSIPVFNITAKKQQTLNQGISVFRQIMDIRETYGGDLSKVDLKLKRDGSGKNDTRYTVIPIPSVFKPEMMVDSNPASEADEGVPF